jgi:hypothetical protein
MRSVLRGCGCACFILFCVAMSLLGILHQLVVDQPGCMGVALSTAAAAWASTLNTTWPAGVSFPPETVIRVSYLLNSSSITSAWATGARLGGPNSTDNNDGLWVWSGSRRTEGAGPTIWTLYVPPSPAPAANTTGSNNTTARLLAAPPPPQPPTPAAQPRAGGQDSSVYALSVASIVANDAFHSPDYLASSRSEQITMGQAQRTLRGYPVINLTVPLVCEEIPGTNPILLSFSQWNLWSLIVDTDALALNSWIVSLPLWPSGYMVNSYSGEAWTWQGLVDTEDQWGLEPSIEVHSLENYPWFTYPHVHREASGGWLLVLQLFSKFYYFVIALLAFYVASVSAAMLLRSVCSEGTGAIFVVLAALDSCRRPSHIFSGLCGCVVNPHGRSAAAIRRELAASNDHRPCGRLRDTLSTHGAKTCPALFALFMCTCATCCCCPCCDLITPSDWTASRVRRPRRPRGRRNNTANTGGDLLIAAGVIAQPQERERYFDEDDDSDEDEEEGSEEQQLAAAGTDAAAGRDVEQGTDATTSNNQNVAARRQPRRQQAPNNNNHREEEEEGRANSDGSEDEGAEGAPRANGEEEEEASDDEDDEDDEDTVLGGAESRMLQFAWMAASTFYPHWGDHQQQIREEGRHEEVRLRRGWEQWRRPPATAAAASSTGTAPTATNTGRPVARTSSFSSTSENDRSALIRDTSTGSNNSSNASGNSESVAVAVASGAAAAEGAAAMPSSSRRDTSTESTHSSNSSVASAASRQGGGRLSRSTSRLRSQAASAFVSICGWCCCRPLLRGLPPAPARRHRRNPPPQAQPAHGSWLHPAWWRNVTREQLSFTLARWQGTLWALAIFLSVLGVFGSGTIELKSHPDGLALSFWSIVLVCEYWSLLYNRTITSMLVFSRITTYSFVALFVYWLSFTYPPIGAGLAAMCFLLAGTMVLLVSEVEAPALAHGKVSSAVPRQAISVEGWGRTGRALTVATAIQLSLQQPRNAMTDDDSGWQHFRGLPHAFTLFNPLNMRLDRITELNPENRPTIYDAQVPEIGTQQGVGGAGNNNNDAAAAVAQAAPAAAADAPARGEPSASSVVVTA